MKTNRRNQKPKSITAGKARWLPTNNTRPQTFTDRRKMAAKMACRGRLVLD